MLQIISGKFYEHDDRYNSECKGIIYSNISWSSKIETCVVTLEPADVYGQTSGYVMSYINQLEKEKEFKGFSLVKTGDEEIQKQFKYLCTFGLNAIFDADRNVVYKMCRTAPISAHEHNIPSGYVNRYFDVNLYATQQEVNNFIEFVTDVIGLPRKTYNIVINCLGAFEAALKLLDDDINLAYSMMIYCAETLSQNFDNYVPNWGDYPQNQRVALEKSFTSIEIDRIETIKGILLKDSHLKLSRRFVSFITNYLDDEFFISDAYLLNRAINKDEIEKALINAYNMRSRYVHSLEPIMKQLIDSRIVKNNDVFEFYNEPFLTFGGLTRIVRRVIWNFVKSYEKVEIEKINWRNELPGVLTLEMAPQYWIWQVNGFTLKHITKKLEGFFELVISDNKQIPDIRPLLEKCRELYSSASAEQKNQIFCLYKLYNTIIREEDRTVGYQEFIEENKSILNVCSIYNIATITLPINIEVDISWEEDDCERILEVYNRKKFDGKHIKLPSIIETAIYLNLANSYREENLDKQKEWLRRALFNSSGNKDLQDKILECINTLESFDVVTIFSNFFRTTTQDSNQK